MKRLFTALICATMVLGLTGCGSKSSQESKAKSNGEIKEILKNEDWQGLCNSKNCFFRKENDLIRIDVVSKDDYYKLKEDVELTDDEITNYLAWLDNRRENNLLDDDEWSGDEEKALAIETEEEKATRLEAEKKEEEKAKAEQKAKDKAEKKAKEKEKKEEEQKKKEETVSLEQQNALSKAYDYLNYDAFSHSSLIEQLKFEGYSDKAATYAADNCNADWNKQAAKKAKSYMDYDSFSKQGLIDQLKFEGFTQKQAEYGAKAVGY